jgi:hypothetical protein
MLNKENMQTTATPPRRRPNSFRTPEKHPGRIALYPSAYQCPWLGRNHVVFATIQTDGTTLHTDEGDYFEGVGHWVQAEQRRELVRLQAENVASEYDECPDTPALFRSNNNMLPTVEENDVSSLLDSLDSLEIEINEEDRELYEDDEEMENGVDLEDAEDCLDLECNEKTRATSMLSRRWKSQSAEEEEEECEECEEDDRISPRSVTDAVNGGNRIMNFDIVEDVEEIDLEDLMSIAGVGAVSCTNPTNTTKKTTTTTTTTSSSSASDVRGKGRMLLQKSLSNEGSTTGGPIKNSLSQDSVPMVVAGHVSVTPVAAAVHNDDEDNDEENDAVAAALEVFKSILNGNNDWNQVISSPKKQGKSTTSIINKHKTSPILVSSNH